ncbi:ROK family transcriptional regulator [Sphingomonas sp.]|uniref:ROK family transcriptional regulator n=1 Tax=Sphingomonas sp. TaxID=28214 RepID=UPI003D6C738E
MTAKGDAASGLGATQQAGAAYNRRVVLDLIRREGQASRKLIGNRVGLSPQAVANITLELEELGLIVSRRVTGRKIRGQPPINFAINPEGGDAIGFSLESQRMSAALVNLVGDVLTREEQQIDMRDPGRVIDAMIGMAGRLSAFARDPARVWGIGVALPGPFDVPGMSFVGPTAFEGWQDLAPLDGLQQATGLPVFYNTDSVAGALGELLFGVAQPLGSFFYLHLGIGLGGTLLVERSVYRGAAGNATEIGHTPIVRHGRACYCGAQGCLERYLSLHALSEYMHGATAPELGSAAIADLIAADDSHLDAWCEAAGPYLRDAIGMIENLLDPEAIVLGGTAPRRLLEKLLARALPLRPSVRQGSATRILLSNQDGASALMGAAVLPIYELLSPRLHSTAASVVNHPAQIALSAD